MRAQHGSRPIARASIQSAGTGTSKGAREGQTPGKAVESQPRLRNGTIESRQSLTDSSTSEKILSDISEVMGMPMELDTDTSSSSSSDTSSSVAPLCRGAFRPDIVARMAVQLS